MRPTSIELSIQDFHLYFIIHLDIPNSLMGNSR
nr:MAG TPA: hypothetical protein [Caudoviricetes sp.]DAR36998.1 MAG TPA: hypothetical protein [Caudoviricetes sp.]DAU88353.1 MAG TPA: hypothetical protein [Caudoviricetes sp.]DAZ43646.1 MAG TPA: hypothetical protein [Caudoviricetes sp.]